MDKYNDIEFSQSSVEPEIVAEHRLGMTFFLFFIIMIGTSFIPEKTVLTWIAINSILLSFFRNSVLLMDEIQVRYGKILLISSLYNVNGDSFFRNYSYIQDPIWNNLFLDSSICNFSNYFNFPFV